MTFARSRRTRLLILAGIVIVACLVGFLVWRPTASKPTTGSAKSSGSTGKATAPSSQTASTTGAADFSYATPSGWAPLSKSQLDAESADSGIATTGSTSLITFLVKVNAATPRNQSEMVSASLDELKKLPNFVLISSVSVSVDGQPAHKFDYHTGTNPTVRQQMYVFTYRGKTFFLLFSGADSSFTPQNPDLDKILTSFKLL